MVSMVFLLGSNLLADSSSGLGVGYAPVEALPVAFSVLFGVAAFHSLPRLLG